MNQLIHRFPAIRPFQLSASYSDIRPSDMVMTDQHLHAECEIYVNVSGNVSFMVEDTVYPISPGSIVISRPYEYHHCIYHSNAVHRHYWILFSSEGNERLLTPFFDRERGEGNLCVCPSERTEELFSLCRRLTEKSGSVREEYALFFQLTDLIAASREMSGETETTDSFHRALRYLNANFREPLTVSDLAEAAHVSVNTLERYFKNRLGVSPIAYLRRRRLSYAAMLLHDGKSVEAAAELSGFWDVSYFIVQFKKVYAMTPLQYRKQQKKP